jgi:calcineurin-like phosphoesterase family protein
VGQGYYLSLYDDKQNKYFNIQPFLDKLGELAYNEHSLWGYIKDNPLRVKDYHELAYKDARFILFHFPILEWAHYWRKSVHLYGHNHRPRKPVSEYWDKRAINVGVDVNGFYPISAEVIYERAFDENGMEVSCVDT